LQLTQTLARLLAAAGDRSVRDGERAVELATQAVTARSSLENAETMAMAMAEAGRFENAVALQSRLVEEAEQRGEEPLLQRLRAHLALYRRGQSCCGD
jgi:multidrug resistance efflux pump